MRPKKVVILKKCSLFDDILRSARERNYWFLLVRSSMCMSGLLQKSAAAATEAEISLADPFFSVLM